jgi:hypothetical protein
MEVSGQHQAPATLPTGTNPVTHKIGDWVGPRAGLDVLKNGIRTTDRPVRSCHYTDCWQEGDVA